MSAGGPASPRRGRRGTAIAAAFCAALYVVHFGILAQHVVDVPYWDEWSMLLPGQFPDGFSVSGLFVQHVDHRPATTRLLHWISYWVGGWNLVPHQLLNFVLFGLLLVAMARYAAACAPALPGWVILAFMAFLLSPLHRENHTWAFQAHVHLWLLGFLVSARLLMRARPGWTGIALGVLAAWVSMYSNAAGVAAMLVTLTVFVLFRSVRLATASDARRGEVPQAAVAVAAIGAGALAWGSSFAAPPSVPPHTWPWTAAFWPHYLELVGLGFGLTSRALLPGAVCLAVVALPLGATAGRLWRRPRRSGDWTLLAGVLGMLAALAAVSFGRAGFGSGAAPPLRYAEYGMGLVPLTAAGWSLLLRRRSAAQAVALAALWLACAGTFADDWTQVEQYARERERRLAGRACIHRYYRGEGDGVCPTIYPEPLAQALDAARRLEVSFARAAAGAPGPADVRAER